MASHTFRFVRSISGARQTAVGASTTWTVDTTPPVITSGTYDCGDDTSMDHHLRPTN